MTDSILRSYQAYTYTSAVPFPIDVLLLQTYTNALNAYSFRKISSSYAGSAVRIRRSSDSTELDVGFSGVNFDAAAAASHIGGGSGFITTFYDQSGNGRNATQTTAGSQPLYVASAQNGQPAMRFDGTDDWLDANSGVSVAPGQAFTFLSVWKPVAIADSKRWFHYRDTAGPGDDTVFMICTLSGLTKLTYIQNTAGDTRAYTNTSLSAGTEYLMTWQSVPKVYVDGSDDTNLTNIENGFGTGSGTKFTIGARGGDHAVPANMEVSELIVWPSEFDSTDRSGAEANANAYWAVF